VLPLLPRLMPPLRLALSSSDVTVVTAVLNAISQLAAAMGEALMPHITPLLVPINRHDSNKAQRENVRATLAALEVNGGPNAAATLRSKLPSYGR
jgi:hypothetical protein